MADPAAQLQQLKRTAAQKREVYNRSLSEAKAMKDLYDGELRTVLDKLGVDSLEEAEAAITIRKNELQEAIDLLSQELA